MLKNFIFLALIASTAPVFAAENGNADDKPHFSLRRTFSLPNLPAEKIKAELFHKANGNVVLGDTVDLNLKFSEEHGKPSLMPPQMAPQTSTIIFRHPDGWWTMNLIRVDGDGAYICRVSVAMFEPKPSDKDFSKYVFWCQAALTLSTLDPAMLHSGTAEIKP